MPIRVLIGSQSLNIPNMHNENTGNLKSSPGPCTIVPVPHSCMRRVGMVGQHDASASRPTHKQEGVQRFYRLPRHFQRSMAVVFPPPPFPSRKSHSSQKTRMSPPFFESLLALPSPPLLFLFYFIKGKTVHQFSGRHDSNCWIPMICILKYIVATRCRSPCYCNIQDNSPAGLALP